MQHSQSFWPLYLVFSSSAGTGWPWCLPILPMLTQELAFVTASFAFARLLTGKLRYLSIPPHIVRVVYYNRSSPVTSESSDDIARLDSAWKSPPSVLSESYCQLCMAPKRTSGSGMRIHSEMVLHGVGVSPEIGSRCISHASSWAPQFLHERLQLNTLHQQWDKINTPGVHGALRSAKLSWTGLLYFSRSMQNVLPAEVINMIESAVVRQY